MKTTRLPLLLLASAALSGCGADTGATTDVEAYLASRYQPGDVRHSFRTKAAETIDCVDFLASPGARALAAAGTPLAEMPRVVVPPEIEARMRAAAPAGEVPAFDGSADEDGNARACPDGTVAEVRLTAERIARVGGLEAFRRAVHRKAPPRVAAPGLDFPGYGHVTASWEGVSAKSGSTVMTIANPGLTIADWELYDDHSLA
jgi:hypothetical protein